jgi:hypothetical protein
MRAYRNRKHHAPCGLEHSEGNRWPHFEEDLELELELSDTPDVLSFVMLIGKRDLWSDDGKLLDANAIG